MRAFVTAVPLHVGLGRQRSDAAPDAMRAVIAALLLGSVGAALGFIEYTTSPPGGLSPDQVPQFVLFTHDDAVNSESYAAVRSIANGREINGCPITATMFTKVDGTECSDLVDLYNSGFEVADHSITHSSFPELSEDGIREEIVGARQQLAECGIPEEAIVGVRTPFLRTNPTVRQIIHDSGFLYDSTQRIRGDPAARAWPWDMTNGIPNCDSNGTQACDSSESYPGLFEVPVWFLDAQGHEYHMNYGEDGAVDVFTFLKEAFDASYNGNRAPFPLFVHTPWIEEFDQGLRAFVDYAATKPDVYFITVRQLLAWMQNPVPKDQMSPEALGCGNQGGTGPSGSVPPSPAGPAPSPAEEGGAEAPAPSKERKKERIRPWAWIEEAGRAGRPEGHALPATMLGGGGGA
ncbi:hypothetical protein ABPG75_010591 [Micractinium tetrahymenae]